MKKILVIGSTVVDILINVEKLPSSGGDVHALNQKLMLGGCAYNVHKALQYYQTPSTLFSPVGTGVYGEFVKNQLLAENCIPTLYSTQENGCCYCLIEPSGERSFISYHGAEYIFEKAWFEELCIDDYDSVYICGLELEETSGPYIVDFICQNPQLQVYFALGPRVNKIDKSLIDRLLEHGAIVHANADEYELLTGKHILEEAMDYVLNKTGQSVICTLGKKGSVFKDEDGITYVACDEVEVVNTNGAGDSHFGAFIAQYKLENESYEALEVANKHAAKVVQSHKSHLE